MATADHNFLSQEGARRCLSSAQCNGVVQACLSEHAFERPSASQVLDQLKATSCEHQRSLRLPQLQLCPSTSAQAAAPSPKASDKTLLKPPQSFPCFQDILGAALGHSVQPKKLLLSDVALPQQQQQRPVPPAQPLSQDVREPSLGRLHASRSFSLAGGDAMRGAACMSGMRGSRASTHKLTSPRLCSNVPDSISASRAGLSGVWSSVCASDVQRGGASEVICNGTLVGDGCRTMPHTTSVRFGLASAMRPLSAQSSSVSGWLSEGSTSMSFASHATAY